MAPKRIAAAALLLCYFVGTAGAADFECLPFRPSRLKEPRYGPLSGSPICEGYFERDISAPFLELMSLTDSGGIEEIGDAVSITTIDTAPGVNATLHVQPLSISTLYRADAAIDETGLVWNTATIKTLTGLSVDNLGFLATTPDSRGDRLIVTAVGRPSVEREADSYRVTVRVSAYTSSIVWRAYPTFAGGRRSSEWQESLSRPVYAWDHVSFDVPRADDGRSISLEVRATGRDGERFEPVRAVIVGRDYETR